MCEQGCCNAKVISINEDKEASTVSDFSSMRKIMIYVMAVLESFLFGLLLFGWSSMVYVYKQEGVYEDLCHITHFNR